MTTNPLTSLTVRDLKKALALRQKIDSLSAEFARLVSVAPSSRAGGNRMRRKRLPAGNSGAKSDWRGRKRGSKRKELSRTARARLSALAKARWAKAKAGGKNRL